MEKRIELEKRERPSIRVYNEDQEEDDSDCIKECGVEDEENYEFDSEEDEATDQLQELANTELETWISAVDDALLLQNSNEENIKDFPATATEFRPLTGGYKTKLYPPLWFYQFNGKGNKYLYIGVDTLKFLFTNQNRMLKDVDLDFLTDESQESHQEKLIDTLNESGVKFRSPYKRGVDIRVCKWSTLVLISRLELPHDIIVSGGGSSVFSKLPWHRNKRTSHQDQTYKCYSSYRSKTKKQNISVGIIDTGSLPPNRFANSNGVIMHHEMFNTNFKIPKYTPYCDNTRKHGTAIVEIVKNGLLDNIKIFVARVSRDNENTINSSKIISAMQEFERLNINVVNCSFSGEWKNRRLAKALESLQASGATIIASAGNSKNDYITSDLNNGRSLMVGSHNEENAISEFSSGQCKVHICALGERISVRTAIPNVRSGTSYAVPQVAAVVGNYMAFVSRNEHETLKGKLAETAEDIKCRCPLHNGQVLKLKINPIGLMSSLNLDKDNSDCIEELNSEGEADSKGDEANESAAGQPQQPAGEEAPARGKKRKHDD